MKKNSHLSVNSPIGIFDSGVGGTSIWKEIHQLLPSENSIYLADSANAPYGIKSKSEIIALCKKNTELLLDFNCKIIVVACNTATTNAIQILRSSYPVSFIGIEPAIKPASLNSKSQKVGILATKGTLASDLFHKTSSLYNKNSKVFEQEGTGIVELIEGGLLYSTEMKDLLNKYLKPMVDEGIDHLVLGCSHYPYLIPVLNTILPESIKIIDSGMAVAKQTKNVLAEQGMLKGEPTKSNTIFYTNGTTTVLTNLLGGNYPVKKLSF